jgi:hypothetical protein
MLTEFDEYGAILFKDFECAFSAAFVAGFQDRGFFLGVVRLMLEGDSIARK